MLEENKYSDATASDHDTVTVSQTTTTDKSSSVSKKRKTTSPPENFCPNPQDLYVPTKTTNPSLWAVFRLLKGSKWPHALCTICFERKVSPWWIDRPDSGTTFMRNHMNKIHPNYQFPVSNWILVTRTPCVFKWLILAQVLPEASVQLNPINYGDPKRMLTTEQIQLFDNAVLSFFTALSIPLQVIDSEDAFKDLCRVISSQRYCPFSRATLRKRILIQHLQVETVLKEMLLPTNGLGLATDHYSSRIQQGLVSMGSFKTRTVTGIPLLELLLFSLFLIQDIYHWWQASLSGERCPIILVSGFLAPSHWRA